MKALLAALLALPAALPSAAEDYPLPSPPLSEHRLDYSADQVEFVGDKSTLHLSGAVTVKESTMTMKGEDFWIDTINRSGRSDRPFIIDNGASAVYGQSGSFDFARHTGRLYRSSTGVASWRVHAREARMDSDRSVRYRGAHFTSCEAVPPHYHFHASAFSVVPKKRVLAYNVFYYLGPVPVFYTPIFYHSLDPNRRLRWRFQPGYDRRAGAYLKGSLTTHHTPATYSKIFDDYYANKGFGWGAEIDHHADEDSRGSLFGYRIHENGTARRRWGVFGGGYRNLGAGYSLQGRVQFQSDPNFTNDYVRSDIFRLTPNLINSAALTKIFSRGTARLTYSRLDVESPTNAQRFVKDSESVPRLEFQSVPLRIGKLPWLNTFVGSAENNFNRARPYLEKTVNGAWTGTRNFHVARGVSFTPSLNYSETYYNRFDLTNYEPRATDQNLDSFIGRWTAANTLRFQTPIGDVDATHAYTRRLRPNEFVEDTGNADRGVEQHLLTLTDVVIPSPNVWARFSTGYDYRTFRDRAPSFYERASPLTTDVAWRFTDSLAANLHHDYQIGARRGRHRSVIGDLLWGDEQGVSVRGGVVYNLSSAATTYQSLDFSFSPSSPTWRVTAGIRTLVVAPHGLMSAQRMRVFEKEISWSRRWHDFYTKLHGRIRPGGVGEFSIRIEFKFGTADPKNAPRRDWEAEWFPGRARENEELRP